MKKILAMVLCAAMVLALCACGSGSSAPAAPAASSGSSAPAATEPAPAKKVTLTMMNIWCGADSKTEGWTNIVNAFNAEYEGQYEVVLEDQADYDAYADKLKTLVSSGDAPDLFTFKAGVREMYSASGMLFDMTDAVYGSDVAGRYSEDVLNGAKYNGTLYCLPYETAIIPLMYNGKLLDAAGVSIPTTYDELYAASDAIRASGVYPIAQSTGSNSWFAQLWHSYCLAAVMGADIFNQPYDSEGWIAGTELYKTLTACSEDDLIGSDTSVVNGNFFNERAAMYCNGTWILGRIRNEGVEGLADSIKISGSPSYNGKNGNGYMSIVQAYIGAAKTDDPAKKAAVEAFVEFITRADQVLPMCKSSGSLFGPSIDASQLDAGLQTEIIDAASKADFLFDNIQNNLNSQVWAVYNDNISSVLLGEITAEEFCGMLATAQAES